MTLSDHCALPYSTQSLELIYYRDCDVRIQLTKELGMFVLTQARDALH